MKLKVERKNIIKYIEIAIGIIAFSIEFNLITSPLNIVVGGSSGLAVIVRKLFGMDTSTFITIFYVIMLVLNFFVYGKNSTKKLIIGSILYPIGIHLFKNITNYIVLDYSNVLMLCIIDGVLRGIACGFTYKNNFLTGGTDVPKKIISDKLKITMGNSVRIFDGILIIFGGFIFGVNRVLYAIIILYITSKVTDKIILGISNKKMFYIMTDKPEEIRSSVKNDLKCGITEIDAIGGYNDKRHNMLMCVIPTRDYIKLKDFINKIDKDAFFIVTDSYHMYYHGER